MTDEIRRQKSGQRGRTTRTGEKPRTTDDKAHVPSGALRARSKSQAAQDLEPAADRGTTKSLVKVASKGHLNKPDSGSFQEKPDSQGRMRSDSTSLFKAASRSHLKKLDSGSPEETNESRGRKRSDSKKTNSGSSEETIDSQGRKRATSRSLFKVASQSQLKNDPDSAEETEDPQRRNRSKSALRRPSKSGIDISNEVEFAISEHARQEAELLEYEAEKETRWLEKVNKTFADGNERLPQVPAYDIKKFGIECPSDGISRVPRVMLPVNRRHIPWETRRTYDPDDIPPDAPAGSEVWRCCFCDDKNPRGFDNCWVCDHEYCEEPGTGCKLYISRVAVKFGVRSSFRAH